MAGQRIIVLKENQNISKGACLREYLPPLLGGLLGKRKIYYRGLWVLIIRRSIHESPDWKTVINTIIETDYDIVVVPAWADNLITESTLYTKEKLEDMINHKAGGKFIFEFVEVSCREDEIEQVMEQKKCARYMKEYIDTVVEIGNMKESASA